MRKVLITGGSRGLGRNLVETLSKNYDVTFTYNTKKEEAEEICKATGAKYFQLNLLNPNLIKEQMEIAMKEYGPFEIIVHNAGFSLDNNFYFMKEEEWNDVILASTNAFYYVTKPCLENMIRNRFGRIVTVVSVSGEAGNRGQVNYSAAKAALIGASKALSKEVASRGITVNCISPGVFETDMTKNLPKEMVLEMIPMKRYGKPSEFSHGVSYLISEEAGYVTGTILQMNGGLYT